MGKGGKHNRSDLPPIGCPLEQVERFVLIDYFESNKARAGHARQAVRGGAISVGARAVNAIVQIGCVVFLARLLAPEDYGLVAMVVAMTGFAPVIVDLGTRDALIQRETISKEEVSALFWITLGVGLFFATAVAFAAPAVARFYNEPRLSGIAMVSALTFLTSAMACQHHALLRRTMQFKRLAVIEVGANVVGAICAIVMALCNLAYWALVLRPIITGSLLAIGLWSVCRWVPARGRCTLGVKEMLKFGVHLTGFSMADFIGRCSDRIAIGHYAGAQRLGYYQKASLVYDNILDLTIALHGVAVVSLSKLREDLPELKRLWSKGLSTLAFFAMPVFGLLAVTSRDFIVILLGEKWASAGILLSVLALRGIPHVVERTLGWLHVSAGRADRWMRWGVFATCTQLVALFAGLPFGPMGVAVSYTVCMFGLFIPAVAYSGGPFGIGARDVVKTVLPQLTGTLIASIVGYSVGYFVLSGVDRYTRTALVGVSFVAVYVVIVVGVCKIRTPLLLVQSLLGEWSSSALSRDIGARTRSTPTE